MTDFLTRQIDEESSDEPVNESTSNPYKQLSNDEYVNMKIRNIAQLACGCATSAMFPNDLELSGQLMMENWEKYVPVVKEALWQLDQADIEEGGLQ